MNNLLTYELEDDATVTDGTVDAGSTEQPPAESRALVAFPLISFANIQLDLDRRGYIVKGLLPNNGLAVVWGPPKCGKSFWAIDLGLHIALGWEYRGRRVQQTTVVYIALEGRYGLPGRKEAFRLHHNVNDAPFYLLTTPLNLVAKVDALIASIAAQLSEQRPGIIFIDTLNRSLVGSESNDQDMAAYIAAAGKIEEKFKCLVVIVHHCGIDATRPRGHTSLSGAVEVQIAVKRGEQDEVIATVELAKDFAEGAEIFSRLEPVTVGKDPDGDDITSLVVVPTQATATSSRVKVTGATKIALDALAEALSEIGEIGPASTRIPAGTRTISVVRWGEFCDAKMIANTDKPDSKRRAFVRASQRLQALGIVGVWNDRVWLTGQAGQART